MKKYYNYDDVDYKGIRDVRILFDLLIDEDYYKPTRAGSALSGNYTECENNGDKGKSLFVKGYLNKSRPYSREMINDLKPQGECK